MKKKSKTSSFSATKFMALTSLLLIALSWPLPILLDNLQIQLFNIPLVYFYIILVGPALILFTISSAVKVFDQIDRQNLETENE